MQQGLGKDFRNSERLDAGTWIAGQFQIIDLIGVGGMGAVYKCMDRMTNRLVAAKVLRRDLTVDSKAVQRFQREAQAIASLEHQNIVKLYNFQSDGEAPMLIMEYVEGSPLNKLLEEQGSLKLTRALDIASQICDALHYAHKAGIIHRDLKPSNIIIKRNSDGSETAKLVDFGIAKINDAHSSMTATGEIFGSPGYMSPEQSTGQMVSESADQYSLGCVLFECLTGSRPFISDTPLAVVMQHVKDPPPTLKEASLGNHFPAELENTVQRMLEKDPARRFDSMLAVRDALSGKKIEAAASPSKSAKAGEKSNRTISNALIGAGIILPIVALSGIGWFLFREGKTPIAAQPSQPSQSNQSNQTSQSNQSNQSNLSSKSNQSNLSAEEPRIDQNTQTIKIDKKNQADLENRTNQTNPVSHATQSNDVPNDRDSSLPKDGLAPSSSQSVNFTQNLFQQHIWRHRTDADIKLPENRTPRIGSLSPEAIKTMSDMEGLKSIDLSGFRDADFFADLKSTTLVKLNLAYTDISDSTVRHFGTNLPNLQKLELEGSKKLRAFTLQSNSLTSLDLSGTDINDTALKSLRTPNLHELLLSTCRSITNAGCGSIANLVSLRQLNIDQTKISNAGIGRLAALPHLESLELGKYSHLSDDCLVEVSKLSHLNHLNMHGIDPKGQLSLLRKLPNLEWLGLASTTLTDKDLLDVSLLTKLKTLDLDKSTLTDRGFAQLIKNSPSLEVKGVYKVRHVTHVE